MRLHVNHKKKYVMITFPKSGCTSLEKTFNYLEIGDLSNYSDILNQKGSWEEKRAKIFVISYIETINLKNKNAIDEFNFNDFDNYYIFSIFRNTYDRVVSMYFNKFLGIDSSTSHLKRRFSFNYFLDWIIRHKCNVRGDHHFNKQWIFEPAYLKVNQYINLNKINEILPDLYETKFSISKDKVKKILKDKHNALLKNKYDIDTKLDKYDFVEDVLNLNILKNGIPQNKLMLTSECVYKIKQLYGDEIDYFKFEVNY